MIATLARAPRARGCASRKLRPVSSDAKTDVRATVRVLLRGAANEVGKQRRIAGYVAIVIGPAPKAEWMLSGWQEGDVEAVVWTTPPQVASVAQRLREAPGVVDAHGHDG